MHFLILNGSPKGKNSVTLQTCLYLEKLYPAHRFDVIHAGQRPDYPEKHPEELARRAAEADCLLFVYPVYTFLIPAQLMRFMEGMKASGIDFTGKYASQITTSKHFYDITAHRFVREFASDMGMKFVEGLSADMEDLLSEKGRKEARQFFDYLLFSMKYGLTEPASPAPVPAHRPVTVPASTGKKDPAKRVAVVADLAPEDEQLTTMIRRFRAVFPYETDLINLREFPFSGGCLGCFRCAADGVCVYKDGFSDMLRERIQTADAIVTAFTVRDRGMGSLFKTYDDRQFCNGHRTVAEGKPFAYLVSGGLDGEDNLKTVLEARASVGHSFLAGFASDADGLRAVSMRLSFALEKGYNPPRDFYGVGGMKIFRDLVWLMRGMMREDHRFYKERGLYDFPQRKWPRMLGLSILGALLRSRRIKRVIGDKMNEGMLAPYKKILDRL